LLVVLAADRRVHAVAVRVGAGDDDVLHALVVRRLQLRQGHPGIAARGARLRVVGVVRLDGRDGRAHVRLGSLLVRPVAEAEVRRDGDREQDADDDDDDKKLDEGEAALLTSEPLLKLRKHSLSLVAMERWPARYRPRRE